MSRTYTCTRVRGLAPWSPRGKTQVLLSQVQEVLEEYKQHLPLTCRQVFYRLVGAYAYPKDENAYNRLTEMLNRARRAQYLPFDAIRDDGTTVDAPAAFDGLPDFWDEVKAWAKDYRRYRQAGQAARMEVWVEAAGMVPQVARVAGFYGVPVHSSGGFESLTAKYEAAARAKSRPTVILSVGDHDPSGWALFDNAREDVPAMAAALAGCHDMLFERVAILPEQIEQHGLTTYPAKETDRRGGWEGPTCQCEALDPAVLAAEVEAAILRHVDENLLADVVWAEKQERVQLLAQLETRP